ncbi:MAG: SGNH/GDSL hydrolase family protein [Chloroflexota bacterium]
MSELNLVVFGTSILWGQGLEDGDKIHSVVVQLLRERFPERNVKATFLAHSGASTGFAQDGSVDAHREPRIHGEVPTLYPTIIQEIEEFDALNIPSESIDIVLLDAGINDVHVTTILDPFTTPHDIEKQVEIYCHQHMELLIERLLAKFKNAKIVIVGYYEFFTEESEEEYIHTLLKAFGKLPVGPIIDAVFGVAEGLIKRRLLTNCATFSNQSRAAFEQVAADLNSRSGSQRVFVACPDIAAQHAAFASDPWLYGINDDLSPQDPVAHLRSVACISAGLLRTQPLFCEKASAGHPNPKGAKAYAEAILAVL